MKHLIFALLALVLIACGSATATTPPTTTQSPAPTEEPGLTKPAVKTDFVRSEASRITSPEISAEQLIELVRNNNSFALDLYRTVAESHDGNLIYSPYSISLAFTMVYAGARGQTEAQMAEVLHYLPQEAQHPAFNALDQRLSSLGGEAEGDESTGEPFQLNIANAVWGQKGFPFREAYLDTLAQQYGAGLRVEDFTQNPDESRQRINAWVAEETQDRIKDLLGKGVITPDTRLVLGNAIYFKAGWLLPFNESATQDGPFTLLDGSQVTVPMMQQHTARVPYAEGDGYQAVLLPYTGRDVEMLIILPEEGRYESIEAGLSADLFDQVRQEAETRDVTLAMPRYDLKTDLDLAKLLQGMGMTDPFGPSADFSGIVEGGGLYISAALHRGTITVDEKGTEAAAATVIVMAESAMPRAEVTIDHPFIFGIVERETGSILFLGRVLNPARS